MKTLSPKVIVIIMSCFAFFNALTLNAQTTISKSENGKLIYEYKKKDNNNYQVVIIYKNDQYIYTPEIDSVVSVALLFGAV